MTLNYEIKNASYYRHARREILPLIPSNTVHILDVGCGDGATASLLKQSKLCQSASGIELMPVPAETARQSLDHVWQGAVEDHLASLPPQRYDVVLCLDVLEHLLDPGMVLQTLTKSLTPNGVVIISLPNMQHYSVTLPLLFCGRWKLTDSGLQDRTHLRWFTRSAARAMIEQAGLKIDREERQFLLKYKLWQPKNLLKHILKLFVPNLFTVQYVFRARLQSVA